MVPEKLTSDLEKLSPKQLISIIKQLNKDMVLAGFQIENDHESYHSLLKEHAQIIEQLLSGKGNITAYIYRLDLSENLVQDSLKSSDPISTLSRLCISRAYMKIKLRQEFSQ